MKKILLGLASALCLLSNTAIAQTQTGFKCGNPALYNQLYQQFPELQGQEQAIDARVQEFIKNAPAGSLEKTRAGEVIIPLVFHIMHSYGAENISDAQVLDAVSILNRDYNKQNADTSAVITPFKNLIGNANFKFKLARKDPNGNCTNGIDRVYSYKTFRGDDASKLNSWSRNYYFNVWVTNQIGAPGSTTAGYAYKPQSLNGGFLNVYDGIIIIHEYIGSIGTGTPFRSRALTHEFGHSLGLDHTWGGTNLPTIACGDDGVIDTPPTEGHDYCATVDLWDSVCTPPVGSPIVVGPVHNTQNYMEYSYCTNMFTIGQVDKMKTTSFIDGNAQRNLLITPLAWQISGIDSTYAPCAPVSDFMPNRFFACLGTATPLTLSSQNKQSGTLTYNWTMPNSASNSATTANVSNVNFTTTGWQPISLATSNGNGTSNIAKNDKVYISDPANTYPINYAETFNDPANVAKWPVFNVYENYFTWKVVPTGGFNGGACIKMNTFDDRPAAQKYFGTPGGDYDDFISPAFNTTGCTGCTVNFWSSAATNTNNYTDASDSLAVYYSVNCGTSWARVDPVYAHFTNQKNNLFNKLQMPANYSPQGNSDWVARSIPLPAAAQSNATYFKFHYRSSNFSNNMYLDDIGVGNWPTEIMDLMARNNAFSIYPNPNNGTFSVSVKNIANTTIIITDVTGKVLDNITTDASVNNGSITTISKSLPSGIYFASLMHKGVKLSTQKFVVN
jgi:Pregnancy-associated plasma protein-A/Secretion system C-terminal sorting domain